MGPLPCSPCGAGIRPAGGACRCHAGEPATGKASLLLVAGRPEAPGAARRSVRAAWPVSAARTHGACGTRQLTGRVVSNR
jgi:hypothetical protein